MQCWRHCRGKRLTGAQIAAYCGTSARRKLAESLDLKDAGHKTVCLCKNCPRPETADAGHAYLRAGLRTGDILVDIGSGGTTQLLLERLLACSCMAAALGR